MNVVVGVDGGGTGTRALVADLSGKVLGKAEGPGCRMQPGGAERSAGVIADVVRHALTSVGQEDLEIRVLYAGIAGTGREPERRALEQELIRLDLADEVRVDTDAAVALSDAFDDGVGILLLAGTGSIAFGRGPTGVLARCGGWGSVFGDEGSGAWIGRKALGIVSAAADGREPETALTGAILTAAQVNQAEELIPWALATEPADLAELAPLVFATAMAGDVRANALVNLAAEELVLHVRALARRLFVDERAALNVALSGGLLGRGSLLRKRVEQRLKSAVPGATLRKEPVNPANGAVRSALRLAGTQLPFPASHDGARQAVPNEVDGSSGHVEDRVDAK